MQNKRVPRARMLRLGLAGMLLATMVQAQPPPRALSADGMTLHAAQPLVPLLHDPSTPAGPLRVPAPAFLHASASGLQPLSPSTSFQIDYAADFPAEARAAFDYAATIWAQLIDTAVPITINARWQPMGTGVLGSSGGGSWHVNFPNAPQADTWYFSTIANAYAGYDLDTNNHDMHITLNKDFTWYYGLDGNTPGGLVDFVTVSLHEICHGLNFAGSLAYNPSTSAGQWGTHPNIYDTFARDGNGVSLLNTTTYPNPSVALGTALTSNDVWFHGAAAMAANGGARVKLYAPAVWKGGSSYAHLDYDTFAATDNALMVYALSSGRAIHDPGSVTMGLLGDLGWDMPWYPPASVSAGKGAFGDRVRITWNYVPGATHYRVYRAIGSGGTKQAVSGWQVGWSFDDFSVVTGTVYHYWVRAAKSDTGADMTDYSSPDTGWSVVLQAPAGVTASDGTFVDKVRVVWDAATAATHYRVSRATTPGGTKTHLGSWQTSLTYDDGAPSPEVTYYYWVRSAAGPNGEHASDYSAYDTGWKQSLVIPTNISATDGTSADHVRVTWIAGSGSPYNRVSRALTLNGSKTDLGSWQQGTTFDDTSAAPLTTYYYFVRSASSSGGAGATGYSGPDTGWRSVAAPTGFSASTGSYPAAVRLYWNASEGATHYRVYRADLPSDTPVALGEWQPATEYIDSSAVVGVTYSYWVRSSGSSAGSQPSVLSVRKEGYWRPAIPAGVQASDGTHPGGVDVTWPSVAGATHYRVQRSSSLSAPITPISGWQTGTSYLDTSVTPGAVRYYSVQSAIDANGTMASNLSASDAGHRGVDAPANVRASDGTRSAYVEVEWDRGDWADYYRVSRSVGVDGAKTDLGAWQTQRSFVDTTAEVCVTYHYWVRAALTSDGGSPSAYGGPDTGWRSLAPPTSLSASFGTYADRIEVRWEPRAGATHHQVARAQDYDQNYVEITGWITNAWFDDTTAVWGTTYQYMVRSATGSNGENASAYSYHVGGWLRLPAPGGVLASDNTHADRIAVSWNPVPGASHYLVFRATTPGGTGEVVGPWQSATSFDDTTTTPGAALYYRVRAAVDESGSSPSGDSDRVLGRRALTSPSELAASDGSETACVRVSWAAEPGATHFLVSRSDTLEGSKLNLSGWQTALTYDDTSATPGTDYLYWVQSATSSGGANASGYGASDVGWRALSAPASVSASDGVYSNFVLVSWSTVPGATHHRLSRSETPHGAKTVLLDWQAAHSFEDGTAQPGKTYFYWAQGARSAAGARAGALALDTGWRGLIDLPSALDAPELTWNTGGNADWVGQTAFSYDGQGAGQSGAIGHNQSSWMDATVQGPGLLSFQWKASSELNNDFLSFYVDGVLTNKISGREEWSLKRFVIPSGAHTLRWEYAKNGSGIAGSDTVWVDQVTFTPAPAPPATVAAGDGAHTDRIVVDWSAAPGASHYRLSRSDTVDGAKTTLTGWISETTHTDFSTVPGAFHYYWVEAAMSDKGIHASGYSTRNKGYRAIEPPFMVMATNGDHEGFVRLTWSSVYGATRYLVYRSNYLVGFRQQLGTPTAGLTFDDASATPGKVYYYWVLARAESSEGTNVSAFGAYDSGFARISLAEALDTPGWVWTTGGDAPWIGQTSVAFDSVDAAQSGPVGHSQATWMETQLEGPGYVAFWWKVSCEQAFDNLRFTLDGTPQATLSGEVDWHRYNVFVPAGPHTLRWTYVKDGSGSVGADSAWVDQIGFTPQLAAPGAVTATDGTHNDKVEIAWNAVAGAARYQVSRSEGLEGVKTDVGDWIPFTVFSDTAAEPGVTYHYWVRSSATGQGDQSSDYSASDTGWRAHPPRPDFIVESIMVDPEVVASGGVVTVTITVRNQGEAGGNAGWVDGYRDKPDVAYAGESSDWWGHAGLLGVGDIAVFEHRFAADGVGFKTYRAFVDSFGETSETNADNNQGTASYSVVPPYGKGFFRIRADGPTSIVSLQSDGTLVWDNAQPDDAGVIEVATELPAADGWTTIHVFEATQPRMERRVFVRD